MSLYLFFLVMDLLLDMFRKKVLCNNFLLYHKCKDTIITHLAFADDLIDFLNGDRSTTTSQGYCMISNLVWVRSEPSNKQVILFRND